MEMVMQWWWVGALMLGAWGVWKWNPWNAW